MIYSGRGHEVEIVDTAGQEEFTSFLDSSLATGDAFMVLYAINSLSSWNELKSLRSKINQEIESLGSKKVPMIIVGNKRVSLFSRIKTFVQFSTLLHILLYYFQSIFRSLAFISFKPFATLLQLLSSYYQQLVFNSVSILERMFFQLLVAQLSLLQIYYSILFHLPFVFFDFKYLSNCFQLLSAQSISCLLQLTFSISITFQLLFNHFQPYFNSSFSPLSTER